MGTQPLVHRGFLAGLKTAHLNRELVQRIQKVMESDDFDCSRCRIFVTGHSLGGALAVLACHELAVECSIGPKIFCYTFGAPRVGNRAFVREYDSLVPNTWQVINDEDVVARVPKFLFMFKHAGRRVIINGKGDMIVSPRVVEVSLYRVFGLFKRSLGVAQHALLNYRLSLVAICEAQFTKGKALDGGMDAMAVLVEKDKMLMHGVNIKLAKLHAIHNLGSQIWSRSFVNNRKLSIVENNWGDGDKEGSSTRMVPDEDIHKLAGHLQMALKQGTSSSVQNE